MEAAVERSVDFVLDMIKSDKGMAIGPKRGYDVRGWGYAYGLLFLSKLKVAKLVPSERRVVRVQLDPKEETADIDTWDNSFPQEIRPTRFELFKRGRDKNPMQKAAEETEREAEDASAQAAGDSAGGAAGDE